MEASILKSLGSIGLSKSGSKVYLDLIKNSSSSVKDITVRTKLHRPNVYDALRRLKSKGFVTEILDSDSRLFKALEPSRIKIYMQQKESEADELIKNLQELPKNEIKQEHRGLFISEGINSVRNAIVDLVRSGEPMYVFGVPADFYKKVGEELVAEAHMERIKNRIPAKVIFATNDPERIYGLNSMEYTEARYLNYGKESNLATTVVGDRIQFISFKEPFTCIVIKNKEIAEALNIKAYRAVGQALKRNKNPIIIPCHRVVKNTGEIGGYSGKVKKKIILLEKEGIEIKNKKINLKKYFFRV